MLFLFIDSFGLEISEGDSPCKVKVYASNAVDHGSFYFPR